jgi:hypothetical protein
MGRDPRERGNLPFLNFNEIVGRLKCWNSGVFPLRDKKIFNSYILTSYF